jgi:hypothetical protein
MVAYADPVRHFAPATFAMTDDHLLPFSFPAVARKKVTAAFDGGRISSGGSVMLLVMADRRLASPTVWHVASPTIAIRCGSTIRWPI